MKRKLVCHFASVLCDIIKSCLFCEFPVESRSFKGLPPRLWYVCWLLHGRNSSCQEFWNVPSLQRFVEDGIWRRFQVGRIFWWVTFITHLPFFNIRFGWFSNLSQFWCPTKDYFFIFKLNNQWWEKLKKPWKFCEKKPFFFIRKIGNLYKKKIALYIKIYKMVTYSYSYYL